MLMKRCAVSRHTFLFHTKAVHLVRIENDGDQKTTAKMTKIRIEILQDSRYFSNFSSSLLISSSFSSALPLSTASRTQQPM